MQLTFLFYQCWKYIPIFLYIWYEVLKQGWLCDFQYCCAFTFFAHCVKLLFLLIEIKQRILGLRICKPYFMCFYSVRDKVPSTQLKEISSFGSAEGFELGIHYSFCILFFWSASEKIIGSYLKKCVFVWYNHIQGLPHQSLSPVFEMIFFLLVVLSQATANK